jgi:hypothetical protein
MYTYNAEAKKVEAPDGKLLTGAEVLVHLNNMFGALASCHMAWGVVSEGVSMLDDVFFGATQPEVEVEGYDGEGEVEADDSDDTEVEDAGGVAAAGTE